MKSKMMVPNYIDDDSDKYGSKKKMNSTGMLSLRLRRQVSSTVLYLQREKKIFAKNNYYPFSFDWSFSYPKKEEEIKLKLMLS